MAASNPLNPAQTLVDEHSVYAPLDARFDPSAAPPTQVAVLKAERESLIPISTGDDHHQPYIWKLINSTNGLYQLDTLQMRVKIRCTIDGKPMEPGVKITIDETDVTIDDHVALQNNILHMLFDEWEIVHNGIVLTKDTHYDRTSAVKCKYFKNQIQKETELAAAGYGEPADPLRMDTVEDSDFERRSNYLSGVHEFIGRLQLDICSCPKLLPCIYELSIAGKRSPPHKLFQCDAFLEPEIDRFGVEIVEIDLSIIKVFPTASLNLAIIDKANADALLLPYQRFVTHVVHLPKGTRMMPSVELGATSTAPRAVILEFVDGRLTGKTCTINRYKSHHYSVKKFSLIVDGHNVPRHEIELAWNESPDGDHFMSAYNSLTDLLGGTPNVTPLLFSKGYFCLALNLNWLPLDTGMWTLKTPASVRLNVQFENEIPENDVLCFIYVIRDSLVRINSDGTISSDTAII